jgi:hypothetical protein
VTVGFTVIYGGKPSGISYLRWETVSSWPGRSRLDWFRATRALLAWLPEDMRTIYIYIANCKCCLWGNRSLSWHSEPLSTWRRTVTYDFPPSVWNSLLVTVMWRRRHLSTLINSAICDWRHMCTTLIIWPRTWNMNMWQASTFEGVICCYDTYLVGIMFATAVWQDKQRIWVKFQWV